MWIFLCALHAYAVQYNFEITRLLMRLDFSLFCKANHLQNEKY